MQTQGTSFYRPFISLTMAFDYFLWGSWAWGFHLSNLLIYAACVTGLYLCAREFDHHRFDGAFPLIGALLFAVFPLHTEVVSWVIARVDSLCAVFYFFSFYFFLKHQNLNNSKAGRTALICSLIFFALSLLSKEMAVVLPPTLVFYLCCFQERKPNNNFFHWLKELLARTGYFWLILLVYLVVRTLSLGSVLGGYQGSLGITSFNHLVEKFWTHGGWDFFFYPYNREVFQSARDIVRLTSILYVSSLAYFTLLTVIFACTFKRTQKLLLFCIGWFVLALAPTISVWNLNESLCGARFAFLASAPFCLLLSALITSPLDLLYTRSKAWIKVQAKFRTLTTLCTALLFIVFLGTFFFASRKNNQVWVEASSEVQALRGAIEEESRRNKSDTDMALLNIPNRYKGAHMLYNGSMLSILLNSPLTDSSLNLNEKVHTFESALFGPGDLINFARLQSMIQQPQKFRIYYWDREAKKLAPFDLRKTNTENKVIKVSFNLTPGKLVASPVIDINPGDFDFAEMVTDKTVPDTKLAMCWNEPDKPDFILKNAIFTNYNSEKGAFIFPVTERKSWLLSKTVHRLSFVLSGKSEAIQLREIRLIKGNHSIPEFVYLTSDGDYKGKDGIVYINSKMPSILEFGFDVQNIAGAEGVLLEISKPNTWFEHYSKSFRDSKPSDQALTSRIIPSLKGNLKIENHTLKTPGYYEIRIAAVNKKNEIVGFFSDPFVFQMSHE